MLSHDKNRLANLIHGGITMKNHTRINKLLTVLLLLCVLFVCMAGAAMAEDCAHSLADGTCTECGEVGYTYDAATNTYTVYTADGLFAVAELVNGGAYSANITLATDIVLNENLADKVTVAEDGTVSADASVRKWMPMGANTKAPSTAATIPSRACIALTTAIAKPV